MKKEQRAQADPWDAVDSFPPGNKEPSGHQQEQQTGSQAEFMTLRKCKKGANCPC